MDIEKRYLISNINDRKNHSDPYEHCVCCHRKVKVLKNEEIEYRQFYIEGAGQLCYDCFQKLYVNGKRN